MYQLIGQYDKTSGQFGLANTAAARAEYLRAAEYRNTDWFDILFSNGLQSNHSLSASGGSENLGRDDNHTGHSPRAIDRGG